MSGSVYGESQVEQITSDFVTEVQICCDLNHPNLVRLLGYADKPTLILVYELLHGSSMDMQLYRRALLSPPLCLSPLDIP